MPINSMITKIFFPCEGRLNDKLDAHKREVEKLIEAIRGEKEDNAQVFKTHNKKCGEGQCT